MNEKTSWLDPKGHVVLAAFARDALIFRPENSYHPFVVAHHYDPKTGEWSHGSYHSDLGHAWDQIHPDIIEGATVRWTRQDIEQALEDQTIQPETEAVNEILFRTHDLKGWRDVAIQHGQEMLSEYAIDYGRELYTQNQEEPLSGYTSRFIPYQDLTDEQRAMVDSKDSSLRAEAARRGYGLDYLAEDLDPNVYYHVAAQGYALDQFKDDPDTETREVVARQGYALSQFKDDPSPLVRATVARQGYALDQLSHDPDPQVRSAVTDYLSDQRLTLKEWNQRNPDRAGTPISLSGRCSSAKEFTQEQLPAVKEPNHDTQIR